MEPSGTGRQSMDVLGENEALQQFFCGQDVSGVMDSTVVDISMLEQYLSSEMDHSAVMLPASPPDSGSETCSPPLEPGSSCHFTDRAGGPQQGHPHRPHHTGPTDPYVKTAAPLTLPGHGHPHPHHLRYMSPTNSYIQTNAPPAPPVHNPALLPRGTGQTAGHPKASAPTPPSCPRASPGCLSPGYPCLPATSTGLVFPSARKRQRSESFEAVADPNAWVTPAHTKGPLRADCGSDALGYDSDGHSGSSGQGPCQSLTWDRYQPDGWSALYDDGHEGLSVPAYHVDTDKGFSYSSTDEAFVCQKKNHFQVTVHVGITRSPKCVRTPSGPQPINSFHVKVFGVKLEAQNHLITIEQSQPDRRKRPFQPVRIDLPEDKVTKVTLGRLHFGETTANNMRKKGKPNPDQRYFLLVVALYASVKEESYLLVAHVSERIIVRASNPAQFESDSDVQWQRGQAADTVVHHGRVGINTSAPDEALVVCGNAKIMGTVMHPSDRRAKQNIQEVNPTDQLKRIAQMRIVEYDYKPEFATKMGIDQVHETGVIAQEVKELLPSAVREAGDITCVDGETIDNFLMVDKEQIFMENVGAVKQLCKLTDNLETRIQELEVWNRRLAKLKKTGSLRSSASDNVRRKVNGNNNTSPPEKRTQLQSAKEYLSEKYSHCLQHKIFQATIITLVATMAFCVISISALYMLTIREDVPVLPEDSSTSSPLFTTSSAPSTVTPGHRPPDVDYCTLLDCVEVYCCPSNPGDHSAPTNTPTQPLPTDSPLQEERKEHLHEILKGAIDWTNTTMQTISIRENQQNIDQQYCVEGNCGNGNYSYVVPISTYLPTNVPVTLQMNTTELLVVHLCHIDDTLACSAVTDFSQEEFSNTMSNTQGHMHEWTLPVAQLYRSSYHFRVAVAGQANCSSDPNYVEALFTDYHFHFYRRCQ
ncbi:myelin regulatory factor-like protein isoform X2 [Anguilla rostrata]|uniref:myelin regulatory factor-like protein isoform X2 n=1 Tax=Anguilla rostrata TaxID=7938 RepID=UPI0030D44138